MLARWSIESGTEALLLSAFLSDEDSASEISSVAELYAAIRSIELDPKVRDELLEPLREADELSVQLRACLEVLEDTRTVVIEHGYFDLDSRSEHALTIARRFRFTRPINDRLHFFSTPISRQDFEDAISRGLAASLQPHYLGYLILRQGDPRHVVGRSLIRPPLRLLEPHQPRDRVRTTVKEDVTLAGLTLTASGVPFMQQEGAITRCAHTAAWIAHYAAVLRGITYRVPVAALSSLDDLDRAYARQYPSRGLTDEQLCRALWRAGLPPVIMQFEELGERRDPLWHDRDAMHDPEFSAWQHENVTSAVSRYLNSGLPVLVATGDHVIVICGYLRQSQLVQTKRNDRSDDKSEVAAFVVHDDSRGPYRVDTVSSLLERVKDHDLLVVPLPPGLLLSGEHAELVACTIVEEQLPDLIAALEVRGDAEETVASLKKTKERLDTRSFAVRSYACDSNDFKASFAMRCPDLRARRQVNLARLPKYIWVTEIVERERRFADPGGGPIVGEVVLDATATSARDAEALILHLPGYINVFDSIEESEQDFACDASHYDSGRWAHSSSWDYGSVARRSKTAGA